jgi:hypothetical protein
MMGLLLIVLITIVEILDINAGTLHNGEWLLHYDTSTEASYFINSITGESYWAL